MDSYQAVARLSLAAPVHEVVAATGDSDVVCCCWTLHRYTAYLLCNAEGLICCWLARTWVSSSLTLSCFSIIRREYYY